MRADWWSCDGGGRSRTAHLERPEISRRALLGTAALGAVWWMSARNALSQVAVRPRSREGNTLVVIFLRGGADGLNIVVPYGDGDYFTHRPTLAIAAPRNGAASEKDRSLDLDGFFALHPAMKDMHGLFHSGKLAAVHACGSGDKTRSHFDAMSVMERGAFEGSSGSISSGWLARYLNTTADAAHDKPLRAVALSATMPDSLRGAPGAIALETVSDFALNIPGDAGTYVEAKATLESMYAPSKDAVQSAGHQTLTVLDTLNRLDLKSYRPDNGAVYPKSDLGDGLKGVAMLIKAGVGLEVACLDRGGWDTHFGQGGSTGLQAGLLSDLSACLAAFAADLGTLSSQVTTVAMTEFGRRAKENSTLGTDHGRASVMFLMGGGIRGGKVYGKWPGLREDQLEDPGDLKVTTDYRTVLGEVLEKSTAATAQNVFPGLTAGTLGILRDMNQRMVPTPASSLDG